MEKERPKIGVNVLVVRNGSILLGLRKNSVGAGTWGLPGGHLELMESLTEAAGRELLEETGLWAESFTFANLINDITREDGHHYVQINFVANGVVGDPKILEPDKCEEWRWFDLDDLPENLFWGHKEIVPAYQEKKIFFE